MGRSFSPGALIDGKYTVEAVLGRGGMGTVVRARHEILRQSVAIKLPAAEFGEHPEVVQRLLREARAAASLKSEHVCRVLDVGLADNNLPYIVMELLEGADLMQVLRKRERISPACACAVIIDVCDALAEAHAMGIVHRDVKPQNIFIAHRARKHPLVKVLDFGISKVHVSKLSGEHMSLTNTSALLGTPSYISPEQIVSTRDVDLRADIWALGVCLYQAMTGKLPFRGSGIMDVAVRISSETVKPPRQHVREIPVSVERVILR